MESAAPLVAAVLGPLATLAAVVIGATLAARYAHSRWLAEARLKQYSDFMSATGAFTDAWTLAPHDPDNDKRTETLAAANEQLHAVRLIASRNVNTAATLVFGECIKLVPTPVSSPRPPGSLNPYLDALGDFQVVARDEATNMRFWRRAKA